MASRRIEVEIIGSSKSLQAALGRSSASLTGFAGKADRLGSRLSGTGRTLSRNVTLPIIAVGAAATKMALDYDTAINHVQALTGASAKQTQQWSDQILKLAPKIGQSPQELANALYFVASSGAKVNQVLPITAASARAAAAGMGDAQTIAQLLTSAINDYGAKTLSASKATDILTEAVKVGKAEPSDLAENMGKVIPVAQNMGVSFAEATTSVSELTNTGLDAAQAATGVRAILTGLLKPASQTTKEFKQLGTSVADVRQEIREKGLNATLQDLSKRIGDNQTALGKVFPNVRALTAYLALTGKNAGNVSKALDQVEHSTGAASQAFKVASGGPGQKLNREMAQLDATAIKIGNDLLPVVLDIGNHIGHLADDFSGLSKNEQHAIEIGLGIAALVGPVARFAGAVSSLASLVSRLAGAMTVESAAATRAGTATAAAGAEAEAAGAAGGGFGLLGPVALAAAGAMAVYYKSTLPNVHVSKQFAAAQAEVKAKIDAGAISATQYDNVIQRSQHLSGLAQQAYHKLAASGIDVSQAHSAASQNVRTFVHQMGQVAGEAERAAGGEAHMGAAAAAAALHAAAYARAARILAQSIDRIPSRKDVDIYLRTHEIIYGTQRIGAPPATTTGGAHPGATGAIVRRPTYAMIGEGRSSEAVVPLGKSAGNSPLGGGNRLRFVIDDWETMSGYIEEVAGGVQRRATKRRGQLQRMGA
jgi:TP901 family phage tail tape measure protein